MIFQLNSLAIYIVFVTSAGSGFFSGSQNKQTRPWIYGEQICPTPSREKCYSLVYTSEVWQEFPIMHFSRKMWLLSFLPEHSESLTELNNSEEMSPIRNYLMCFHGVTEAAGNGGDISASD